MSELCDRLTPEEAATIGLDDVDLSSLVGHEVTLYTDQYRGKALNTKVILVNNSVICVDRSGSNGMIDSLINNQKTVIQFSYKGQRISVNATLKRTANGKCSLVLGKQLTPLSRRRFKRYDLTRPVKCAVLPSRDFNVDHLSRLRWMETDSVNFSSGGVLLSLAKNLTSESYLLLNIDVHEFDFPALIVGQVRYSYPIDKFRFFVGIEFIVGDIKEKHFAPSTIKRMPPVVFEYTASRRKELNRELAVRMHQISRKEL